VESQYEKLGVDIFPNFLRLVRESERGGDVVGNTTIALSMVTDPVMIRKRKFQDHPSLANPEELELLVTATHFDEDVCFAPHTVGIGTFQNRRGEPEADELQCNEICLFRVPEARKATL